PGEPLLPRIEPYRTPDGALRIRGRVDFPEGTRIQLSIYRKGTNQMVARLEAQVRGHGFETPPILTARGHVPAGAYRFDYLALFNPVWQTSAVLGATEQGR